MEIFKAANQWATRPADERFSSLPEMYRACKRYADAAAQSVVDWTELRVEARGRDLHLIGQANVQAMLTNYAFGQLAGRVGAPAGYLRDLPGVLAAQNLNWGLKEKRGSGTDAQLLFHQNGGLLLRAATSTRYNRVWNYEIVDRLMGMCDRFNMTPAHQTFSWDGSAAPDPEEEDLDRALYASDHDMFAFVMTQDRVVMDPVGQPLRRGLIVQNSEVGDKSLAFMGFYFRDVCANHIIWGAERVAEVRFSHVGNVDEKMNDALVEVTQWMDGAASLDEADLQRFTMRIADTKEEVVDKLFGMRAVRLPRKTIEAGYDAVVEDEDGDPRSVWGMVQGLTRVSQQEEYAEDRVEADRAAGKILEIEF